VDIAAQIRRLKNPDPRVREAAWKIVRAMVAKQVEDNFPDLMFLAAAGPDESPVLAMLQNDSDPSIRFAATFALSVNGGERTPGPMVAELKKYCGKAKGDVWDEMETFVLCEDIIQNGFQASYQDSPTVTVGALLKELENESEDPQVRSSAASVLNHLGQPSEVAIPILVKQLEDKRMDGVVRGSAGTVLGEMGPRAKVAVPALLDALRDENRDVRLGGIQAVQQMGPDAKEAIPLLITALRDKDVYVRRAAATALRSMGPDARTSINVLISLLKDEDKEVRQAAAETLAQLTEGTQESLGPLLTKDLKPPVPYNYNESLAAEYERENAAYGLGFIGNPQIAVPALIRALNDPSDKIRVAAAVSLGRRGADSRAAILPLTTTLADFHLLVNSAAADALGQIAKALQEGKHYEMIGDLKQAERALENAKHPDARWQDSARVVKATISYLQMVRQDEVWYQVLETIRKNPKMAMAVGVYSLLTLVTILLLWLAPLEIFRINEWLRPYMDVPIPIGSIKIPLRHVLLIGFFHYHPRVLDRWVSKRIAIIRGEFRKMTTVRDRQVHVQMPAILDEKIVVGLGVSHLRSVFERKRACVLIWGEGGAGKTSLACEMGTWAMEQEPAKRLRKHLMIPILIEHDLEFQAEGSSYTLAGLIGGQLKVLANEETAPSEELVRFLLSRQRILVIVDGLSELSVSTRDSIRPGDPKFSANALVVTSRLEERLEGLPRTNLRPMRIEGNRLSSFMDAYLIQRSKRELFEDAEFFIACSRLSSLVDRRDITVLLAKLYADQMIALKEQVAQPSQLPGSVPELMLEYVNRLNLSVGKEKWEDRRIQDAAKTISWEFLRKTFRPALAKLDDVKRALGGDPSASEQIKYLEDRLRLVETVGAGRDWLKMTLDPLAEYLAALYLVDLYGDDHLAWQGFFDKVDAEPGAPVSIKGFLLALQDCWRAKQSEEQFSNFFPEELAKRGVEPQFVKVRTTEMSSGQPDQV